ncbi:MAG TPA: hypothetical protein VJP59_09010, partial [Gemmatimonadota bacterium]|nr:hypothetical protein [Gemmatimonadota bacterium]
MRGRTLLTVAMATLAFLGCQRGGGAARNRQLFARDFLNALREVRRKTGFGFGVHVAQDRSG